MKLFSPQEVRDKKNLETARDILRTKEVEDVLKKTNQQLAQAEADFASALAKNKRIWANEEAEHAKRVSEMSEEIKELEQRKAQALIPIQMYKDQADTLLKEAQETIELAKIREYQARETQNTLEDKLDELGEREEILIEDERVIQRKKEGIKAQEKNIELQSAELTRKIEEFLKQKGLAEADLKKRDKELTMREMSIVSREKALERGISSLAEEKTKIADQRATLERALNRKK